MHQQQFKGPKQLHQSQQTQSEEQIQHTQPNLQAQGKPQAHARVQNIQEYQLTQRSKTLPQFNNPTPSPFVARNASQNHLQMQSTTIRAFSKTSFSQSCK